MSKSDVCYADCCLKQRICRCLNATYWPRLTEKCCASFARLLLESCSSLTKCLGSETLYHDSPTRNITQTFSYAIMGYFLPSFVQKRILRYALSRLDVLDTDALDLDKLDIVWGKRSTVELRDVGLRLKVQYFPAWLPITLNNIPWIMLIMLLTATDFTSSTAIISENYKSKNTAPSSHHPRGYL